MLSKIKMRETMATSVAIAIASYVFIKSWAVRREASGLDLIIFIPILASDTMSQAWLQIIIWMIYDDLSHGHLSERCNFRSHWKVSFSIWTCFPHFLGVCLRELLRMRLGHRLELHCLWHWQIFSSHFFWHCSFQCCDKSIDSNLARWPKVTQSTVRLSSWFVGSRLTFIVALLWELSSTSNKQAYLYM